MADFFQTVEADVKGAVDWVATETDAALTFIWGVAKPIFVQFEPVVIQGLLTELISFLGGAAADVKAGTPNYIATVFLATLRDTGHVLLGDAEAIGEDLLTVLAGLAKTSLPKVA